ncbi:MAG: DUF5110 domain-containing protein [Anaerolineae bacterium]|nr:DUF5110 domain-containing protein [Anaerolineae bacterium]
MTPELYARWFQWGAFCPIFRTHGTRPENEPWSFGPEVEAICRRYTTLRYRLLPYIYACARQTAQTGRPFMRALVMDFPDDLRAVKAEHQFMFGPAFLVAPVTEPGARDHEVYLPAGVWYDYWTGQRYEGSQAIEVGAPLDQIPLFVRGGAVVPFGPETRHADEKRFNPVEVHIYPGSDGAFDLYEDDGDTYAYERNAYAVTPLRYRSGPTGAHAVHVGPARGAYDGMLRTRAWRVTLHDVNRPASVQLGGARWDGWEYDAARRTLTVALDGRPASSGERAADPGGGRSRAAVSGGRSAARPERAAGAHHRGYEPALPVPRGGQRLHNRRVGPPPTPVEVQLEPPPHWTCAPAGLVRRLVEGEGLWRQSWTLTWDDRVAPSVAEARLTVKARSNETPYTETLPVLLGNPVLAQWMLVGPFENQGGAGFAHAYPPETGIDPRAAYPGKHDRTVLWQRHIGVPGINYVLATAVAGEPGAVGYAATEVWSPEARQAQVALVGEGASACGGTRKRSSAAALPGWSSRCARR